MIKVKLLNKKAKVPTKGTPSSAGWDLYASKTVLLVPGESIEVPTGIALEIPEDWVGLLTHRSSLGFKLDTIASFGVIDSDYRGEVKVKLFNLGEEGAWIKAGDRFAQLVIVPYLHWGEMEIVTELSDTARGTGGLGSTGA